MRLPNESASSWTHIGFASFTYSSLVAWRDLDVLPADKRVVVSDLADALKGSMDELLKEARETQDAQIFARPTAQAKRNVGLVALKHALRDALQSVVSKIGLHSTDHPQVRAFLPKLLGSVTELPVDKRAGEAGRAVTRLRALPDFEGKEALAARLEAAAKVAGEMVGEAEVTYGAWRQERSEEVMAKGKLRLTLETTHRSLGAAFPGQRDFVESFFLRASGRTSEGGDESADNGGGDNGGGDNG